MALPEGSYTQTAYVVKDVEAAARRWTETTGAGPWYRLTPETRDTVYRGKKGEDHYKLVLGFLGATLIELIQPLDDQPSLFNEVLRGRGAGFHHVSPQLAALKGITFDERCHVFEQRGLVCVMTNFVVGLGRAAFYDAQDAIGGFVEVFELGAAYSIVPGMADEHLRWDGSRVIRGFDSLPKPNESEG
jgi:Glyoxalase/Bleomycin resistance protein/Dioxygenase superfamily